MDIQGKEKEEREREEERRLQENDTTLAKLSSGASARTPQEPLQEQALAPLALHQKQCNERKALLLTMAKEQMAQTDRCLVMGEGAALAIKEAALFVKANGDLIRELAYLQDEQARKKLVEITTLLDEDKACRHLEYGNEESL
jgi:hypothetical protein